MFYVQQILVYFYAFSVYFMSILKVTRTVKINGSVWKGETSVKIAVPYC